MSRAPKDAGPQNPSELVAAVCAATYYADLVPAYAFVFGVPSTDTRFTVLARTKDRYRVGETYPLILAEPDAVPLPLSLDDWGFLRQCLDNAGQRWREAIAEADAGADRPQQQHVAEPGYLNVEPTRDGYRTAGQVFREELERVQQFNARLGELLDAAQAVRRDGGRS